MRTLRLAPVLLVAALLMSVSACSPGGSASDAPLVVYTRVWPDGLIEETTVHADGRVLMKHGDRLERFTLEAADVELLRTALAGDIPVGPSDDGPERTLTMGDGRLIDSPRPGPGNAAELLDRLTETHRLEETGTGVDSHAGEH